MFGNVYTYFIRATSIVGKSVVSMEDNRHRMHVTHDLEHQFAIVNSKKFKIALEWDMWRHKLKNMQRPLKTCTVWSTGSFSATVLLSYSFIASVPSLLLRRLEIQNQYTPAESCHKFWQAALGPNQICSQPLLVRMHNTCRSWLCLWFLQEDKHQEILFNLHANCWAPEHRKQLYIRILLHNKQ